MFDGDCGFCRRWIDYWRGFTLDQVDYRPFQAVQGEFPEFSEDKLKEAVGFRSESGDICYGAQAVFRALAEGGGGLLWWCYRYLPGFRWISEKIYHTVSRRRASLAGFLNFFWPRELQKRRYQISRRIFLFCLGVIYAVAFFSLGIQILGLVGSQGILPAQPFLEYLRVHLNHPYWQLPSFFWLHLSDAWLQGSCWVGILLGLVMAAGWGGRLVPLLCWIFYLSLYAVGQDFLGFQWDILLLEAGFLAIFLAPRSWNAKGFRDQSASLGILWLYRWLLFRLMFESGMVKILSGDSSWRNMTALDYHFETQPLPNFFSYYFHHFPEWFHRESVLFMYGVELIIPWLLFLPQPIRSLSAIPLILFQVLILLTGNYGFFNLLSLSLAILLVADRYWPAFLKKHFYSEKIAAPKKRSFAWGVLLAASLILFLSWGPGIQRLNFLPSPPRWMRQAQAVFRPFHLVNSYGLFAVMTKSRPEIIIEGSTDGEHWFPYVLPYKPGPKTRRPPFLLGHMPRLDWQLWFAALNPPGHYPPWFRNLMARLLENSPSVLALFKENPFPEGPPLKVRAGVANYYFSSPQVKRASGEWWVSGPLEPYSPVFEK